MKTQRKIINIGNSLGITLDKKSINELNLKKGDLIEIDIIGIMETLKERNTKTYFCIPCSNYFDSNDEIPCCNICGQEGDNIEEVNDDGQ
jgi:hypothetical protein